MSYSYKMVVVNKEDTDKNTSFENRLEIGCPDQNILDNFYFFENKYYITKKEELLLIINYFNDKVKEKYNFELSLILLQNILLLILNNKIDSYTYLNEDINQILTYCNDYKNLFNEDLSISEKLNNKNYAIKLLLDIQNKLIFLKREAQNDILNEVSESINLGYYNSLNTIVLKLVSLNKNINFKQNLIVIYGS